MALKRKITKEAFDALPPHFQLEYKANDAKTEYTLDVEGDAGGSGEDVGELRRAHEREKAARREAEERARTLQAQLDDESTTSARKKGDIATLEKSWQAKVDEAVAAGNKKLQTRDDFIRKHLGENVALSLASKISTKPNLILPHIKQRITVDFDGDEPKTRILDKDGKPSALTVDDLSKEFVANPDFADIIVGSQASGSGASGSSSGGGASKKLSEMGDAERIAFQKSDPAGFAKAVEADKAATRGY